MPKATAKKTVKAKKTPAKVVTSADFLANDKEIELAIRNEAVASIKFEEMKRAAARQKAKVTGFRAEQQDAQRNYLDAVERVKTNKEKEINLTIQEARAKSALEEAKELKNIKEANALIERAAQLKKQSEIAKLKKMELEEVAKTQQINLANVRKASEMEIRSLQVAMEKTSEISLGSLNRVENIVPPAPDMREDTPIATPSHQEVKTIVVTKKQLRRARKAAKKEAKNQISEELLRHIK